VCVCVWTSENATQWTAVEASQSDYRMSFSANFTTQWQLISTRSNELDTNVTDVTPYSRNRYWQS